MRSLIQIVPAEPAAGAPKEFRKGSEKRQFQAEVNRMLDILINSLYSNKDIFLRELISNAADALDKIRFLGLSNATELESGSELGIRVWADPARRVLSVRDTGVGMTRADLVANLGTVARSGTSAFLEQLQREGDLNLIGQFGVGFYSVYLVADYVEVVTKHNNGSQLVWESRADGEYAISEDDAAAAPLGRGTQINLHLKPDCDEYLQPAKLRELVERYSEFIPFPISIRTGGADGAGGVDPEGAANKDGEDSGDGDVEDDDEEDAKDDATDGSTTKDSSSSPPTWEVVNAAQPLWLRSPSEVTPEEHQKFYRALAKDERGEALAQAHFRAEGDVEFRALVYFPWRGAARLLRRPRVKLYVRRVLISEAPEGLLPRWLGWLVGVVDSDDMPLNVSRETLQLSQGLKVIRKKLVRKVVDTLRRLSDDALEAAQKLKELEENSAEDGAEDERASLRARVAKYATIWREYGRAIKLGAIEEKQQRRRVLPLLRFRSSNATGEELTSLEAYVGRMRPGQERIYYVTGPSAAEVARSPFARALTERGYEVLYLTEPLDEYLTQQVTEYEGRDLVNASKDDLKLPEDEADKEREAARKKEFKAFTRWWKKLLTPSQPVEAVRLSRRARGADAPPCLVAANKFGWSAQMERIAAAQAVAGQGAEAARWQRGLRVLEINPDHAVVRELRARVAADPDAPATKNRAMVLYETCLLESGYSVEDLPAFGARVRHLLGADLGLAGPEPEPPASKLDEAKKEEEEKEKKEAAVEEEEEAHDEL
ncbi:hypothetical protein QBZ16_002817 [Prototheca wickerhamii]|uniref:Histidine kinase/HSP90-like ATPase domain-containing protein n=1 Tax=Prototheca wickerhamii TaxID=3111 RepID=A0AAD9MNM9_PROWI|nr:hypothetical protein QBZ16_002817 [Prototheca wickerhamii]